MRKSSPPVVNRYDRRITAQALRMYTRHLGLRRTTQLPRRVWPMWDSVMALFRYEDGHPRGCTSAMMGLIGAESRLDVSDAPPMYEELPELISGFTPKWSTVGRQTVLCVGELDQPVAITPVSAAEMASLPTGIDMLRTMSAFGQSMKAAPSKSVIITDRGHVIGAPELARVFGYDGWNVEWVPSEWMNPPTGTEVETGFSEVLAGDGRAMVARFSRLHLDGFTAYVARHWPGPIERSTTWQPSVGAHVDDAGPSRSRLPPSDEWLE